MVSDCAYINALLAHGSLASGFIGSLKSTNIGSGSRIFISLHYCKTFCLYWQVYFVLVLSNPFCAFVLMFVSVASDLFGSLYPIVCITALLDHDSLASGFIGPRCLILLILMLVWLKVASPLALLDLGVRFYINAHLAHGSLASCFIGSRCPIVRI